MKQEIISVIICPICKTSLLLKINKKNGRRIHTGKLICNRCNAKFEIIDDVVCFKLVTKRDKNKAKSQKKRDMFRHELKKDWLKNFSKEELTILQKEWQWMINRLNLKNSKLHLDWATGTGRFLKNILNLVKGEIIALEFDYATCIGLKTFLEKTGKYSKVTILCSDARNMPFLNNSIDSVSSWHGIDEPDMRKAVNESKRVLKVNKKLVLSGVFYEKNSKSLVIAKKWKMEFASENKIYRYFKKLNLKNIDYKTFFKAKWLDRKSFLPRFGDYYTSYTISGEK